MILMKMILMKMILMKMILIICLKKSFFWEDYLFFNFFLIF